MRTQWCSFQWQTFQLQWESFFETPSYLNHTPVKLFILGVSSIIRGSDREKHDVTSCGLLEGQGDGDASTLTGQVRLHTKHCGGAKRRRQCEKQSIWWWIQNLKNINNKCNKKTNLFSSLCITPSWQCSDEIICFNFKFY